MVQAAELTTEQRVSLQAEAWTHSRSWTSSFVRTYRPTARHQLEGSRPFNPYSYQEDLWDALDRGRRVCVLKARQIGISFAWLAYAIRVCRAVENALCIVISDKKDSSEERLKDAVSIERSLHGPFPEDFPTLVSGTAASLKWSNGSVLKAIASSKNPGRGEAATALLLDEFAFWPWQETMWSGIRPTISRGGAVAIVSTPLMEGDLFHERWVQAQNPVNGWVPFNLPWQSCPEYNDDWANAERRDYSDAQWFAEYCCEFGRASDAVFRPEHLEAAKTSGSQPYKRHDISTFAIGGDLAGAGRDQTVFVVLDITDRQFRVVDAWAKEFEPAPTIQRKVKELAEKYQCIPWLDRTGIGWGIVQNVDVPAVGVHFTGGTNVSGEFPEINIPAERLISNLVLGLEKRHIVIPPEYGELILGLSAYRWKRIAGGKARYADWVDALSLAYWSATEGFPNQGLERVVGMADVMPGFVPNEYGSARL